MEIKVGGIYRTKDDVHSLIFEGKAIFDYFIKEGTPVRISRMFGSGTVGIIPLFYTDGCQVHSWITHINNLEEADTVEKVKNMASEEQHQMKVLITFADASIVAQLLKGDKTVKTANARCAPDDKFCIEIGAKLALERLLRRRMMYQCLAHIEYLRMKEWLQLLPTWLI